MDVDQNMIPMIMKLGVKLHQMYDGNCDHMQADVFQAIDLTSWLRDNQDVLEGLKLI